MKKILLTLLTLLTTATLWAQAPQRISYQAVIRDGNNVVVASSPVGIKISLLRGTSTGPAVYVETHGIITNANGLMSLNIGEGRAISGRFAEIDWSKGPYLIQTATDPTGGTDYSIIGIGPLNSVPYALNAGIANALAGTLAIANGGTGATTATAARAALGLENVDNTSDANKPVSTAAQTSLSTKVDKVTGKELSTNDYTTAEKTKLAAITGTNTGDQDLSALATTAVVATKASTAELATGLALKANAADVTTSLATKVDKVTGKELSTNDYSTAEKTKLATITGTNTGDQTTITGNAATATKLLTAVTINGIAFDGSADITIATAADAGTLTGIIPVAKGGTGETTVPGILSALGFASNNVAIGFVAGTPNQGVNAGTIAIGGGAGRGNQGAASVAIGYVSGDQNQGSASVAIGPNAAQSGQGTQAVAIGYAAGQNGQGAYSVAVGSFAGNVQAANSIALNATGASLNPSTTGFFVDPIINRAATSTALYYNTTTKEVTSGTPATGPIGGFTHYLGEAFNGGIIYYLYKGSDGLEHGLIVALTESTVTEKWQSQNSQVNADRTEDGAFNTNLMTPTAANSPAAAYIATLGAGWYLPSIDELGLLYYNRYSAQKGLRLGGNTLLSAINPYWSSTEYDAIYAYAFVFGNGYAGSDTKTTNYPVRAVRAF